MAEKAPKQKTEVEKEIEKKAEQWAEYAAKEFGNRFGHVIAIVINIVALWVAHNIVAWNIPALDFIKPEFNNILWAFDLSIAVTITVEFLHVITQAKQIRGMLKIFENLFSLLNLWVLLTRFPFDLTKLINVGYINSVGRILLGLAMFGVVVATIAQALTLIGTDFESQKPKED